MPDPSLAVVEDHILSVLERLAELAESVGSDLANPLRQVARDHAEDVRTRSH
jgi:hypothetical protein